MKRTLMMLGLAAAAFGVVYAATKLWNAPPLGPPGMVWIPGGEFTMGTDSELGWPDEKPAHRVRVDGFWMDETEVTNAQFRTFIQATGYVTTAEKPPSLEEIMSQSPPGTPPPPNAKLSAESQGAPGLMMLCNASEPKMSAVTASSCHGPAKASPAPLDR
jgi:formylglycine-generating enzyme